MDSFSTLWRNSLNRGYTRGRLGRVVIHRWDYRKIKGAKPLSALMMETVTASNPLFNALVKRQKSPPDA
jgi:hypothetical protein